MKNEYSGMKRDALRYRFLRDKDAFGDDADPNLVSWSGLAELDLGEFDNAVDERMMDAGFIRTQATQTKEDTINHMAEMIGRGTFYEDAERIYNAIISGEINI